MAVVLKFERKEVAENDFTERMERIRKSHKKINALMAELRKDCKPVEEKLSYSERKTFARYAELIKERDTWTKQDIISFASWMRRSLTYNSRNRDFKDDIREALWYEFTKAVPKKITIEQSDFGIAWLRKTVLNKKGEVRDNKLIRDAQMGLYHKNVIDNFSHFEFIGYDTDNRYGAFNILGPVYRTYSKDGKYFDYSFSGGPYSVLEVDDFYLNSVP